MNRKQALEALKSFRKNDFEYPRDWEFLNSLVGVLNQPITLADFLGWEEGVEYEAEEVYVLKVENNRLFIKSEECSSGWCNFALFTDKIEDFQKAKKVEKKPKAYHVKDKYSYKCLMEELEEQGYTWISNIKPTGKFAWDIYKEDTVIYCEKNKTLTLSYLCYFNHFAKDTYELIEYHKEEPKYYAKIKGTELLQKQTDLRFFYFTPIQNGIVLYDKSYKKEQQIRTKEEWNELGINDTNADFEEVDK